VQWLVPLSYGTNLLKYGEPVDDWLDCTDRVRAYFFVGGLCPDRLALFLRATSSGRYGITCEGFLHHAFQFDQLGPF
jgi:hypothetical protein